MKKTFGQKLRQVRIDKELTQETLAGMLGISTTAYCKIEQDKSPHVGLERITAIAEVLDIPIWELFSMGEGVYYITNNQHNNPNSMVVHWHGNHESMQMHTNGIT